MAWNMSQKVILGMTYSVGMRDLLYDFILLSTKLFAIPGIFYSNCVSSIFCLSSWTIISGKANTIYPQNSAHDYSLNI